MTLEKYIEEKHLHDFGIKHIGKIPNNLLAKIFEDYKYIDTNLIWYDGENPDVNNWIDVEGIGYGWIWSDYKNSKKKQRKAIIKYALELCDGEELYSYYIEDVRHYLFWIEDCVSLIRLSNEELDWW